MNFTFDSIGLIQIIQTIAILWGGFYLKKKLSLKETQIDVLTNNFTSMKELLSLYNVDEFKKNLHLRLENLSLEHEKERKILIENLLMKFSTEDKEFRKAFEELSKDWIYKYNEILSLTANILVSLEEDTRNKYLEKLPLNREFIIDCLDKIKKGDMK